MLPATVSPIGTLARLYQCPRQAVELFTRHARPLRTRVVTLAESDTREAQRARNQAPFTNAVSLPIAEDFFAMLCAENAVWINPRRAHLSECAAPPFFLTYNLPYLSPFVLIVRDTRPVAL